MATIPEQTPSFDGRWPGVWDCFPVSVLYLYQKSIILSGLLSNQIIDPEE